ncbi:MAG TPA: YfjI family protein [Gemmataceae bacterium]|nr:YfjI family protein [Gemmataceae bacterium]
MKLLPQPLQAFVEQASAAIGCEPSFVALPALAAAAGLVGNARTVRLKKGWVEPLVLWTCIIGDSGSLKSPAISAAVAPVYRRQQQLRDDYERDLDKYEHEKRQYAERSREPRRKSDKAPDESEPEKPSARRALISDVTVEKIAEVLEDNPRGVLLVRDELAGWFGSFRRYKDAQGGSDLPVWLEMHRAGPIIVDRKTGDRPSLFVPHAAVSLTGGVQPETLARCLTAEHMEAGLGARVLLAMPPRRRKVWTENEIHPELATEYERVLRALGALPMDADDDGREGPFAVKLTPEAKTLWVEWYNGWADRQAAAEGATAAAYAKLEGGAARLALLHSIVVKTGTQADASDPIDADSMAAGVGLARWFAGEAQRVYAILAESEGQRASRRLIEFIQAHGGRMTARALHKANRTRYPDADAAEQALDELAKAHLAVWTGAVPRPRGGRPSRTLNLIPHTPKPPETSPDGADDDDDDDGAGLTPKPPEGAVGAREFPL